MLLPVSRRATVLTASNLLELKGLADWESVTGIRGDGVAMHGSTRYYAIKYDEKEYKNYDICRYTNSSTRFFMVDTKCAGISVNKFLPISL
jgi:hypothetical protein